MTDPHHSVTSVSLIARINGDDADSAAWNTFVDRYGRRIYEWCLNRRLQPADAEDVTQEVLVKLAQRMSSFEYDAQLTFRGWLRRITENAITDFFRERRAKASRHVAGELEQLERLEACEDLATRLNEAFDLELLDVATTRVRGRVEERRWRAWEMTAVELRKGEDVATELGMKLPTVYSSRFQVQKMITDEVRLLENASTEVIQGTNPT